MVVFKLKILVITERGEAWQNQAVPIAVLSIAVPRFSYMRAASTKKTKDLHHFIVVLQLVDLHSTASSIHIVIQASYTTKYTGFQIQENSSSRLQAHEFSPSYQEADLSFSNPSGNMYVVGLGYSIHVAYVLKGFRVLIITLSAPPAANTNVGRMH